MSVRSKSRLQLFKFGLISDIFFFSLQTLSDILLSAPKKHLLVVPSCASQPENSRKCIKYFQADEANVNKYHMYSTRVSGSAAGGDEPRRIADNSCQVCVFFEAKSTGNHPDLGNRFS